MIENPFIVHRERTGESADPYISKNETLKLDSNAKVVLSELPDEFQHVNVSGDNKVWYEIRTGLPNTNEYIVDYLQKTVTFHISNVGKQLNFQYLGKGISYINVDNIYTALNNGSVVQTLNDIITSGLAGITAMNELSNFKHVGNYTNGNTYQKFNIVYHKGASYLCNVTTTTTNPELSTDWSKLVSRAWQGTYDMNVTYQFGDSVVDSVNENIYTSIANDNLNNLLTDTNFWFKSISVSNAISNINAKISEATTKISETETARQNTVTATNEAITATTNANNATQSATNAATNAQNLVNTYVHRGDYDSLTNYVVNNEVRYQGSTWRCIQDCVGVAPVEGVNWTLIALKGADGTGSVESVNGMSGVVTLSATDVNAIPTTEKGVINGVATLDADGKVPATQLNVQPPTDASTTVKGIVMLEDSVTSTSITTASTPNSVKTVNDKIGILTSLDNTRQIENIGYGVQSGLNVLVTATPDMNIHVQAGTIYMLDGQRFNFNTVTDLAVTTADVTNPRKDVVYVSSTGVITYLAGIASATPVEPILPIGGFKLCVIDISTNDTTIEQIQIADSRILKDNLPSLRQTVEGYHVDDLNQFARQDNIKNNKFLNNKNAILTYGTSINFIGDSITEGTKATNFVDDGYVGIINKAFQKETGLRNHGFVSFWDVTKIYGITQYHTLTKQGFGDGTFNPYYAGGIVIESSLSGDYIEATFTGKGAKLVYSQMTGGGIVDVKLDGVSQFSLDTSGAYSYFDYYATSQIILASTWGTHTIRITKLDNNPTKLLGMIYLESDSTPYVNNFGRSSLSLNEITNNGLLDFYTLSGMTVLSLGVNDQMSSLDINIFKSKLAYICDKVVANKGNLIICDFMFSLSSSDPYKTALKDNFKSYPQFQLLDFGEMWFSDLTKNKSSKLLDADGVHPTVQGHEFIANVLMKYIGLPYTKALINKLDNNVISNGEQTLTAPTLLNGWINFAPTTHQSAGFYMDGNNTVHLVGFIKSGTTTANTVIFNLPVGRRPLKDIYFPTVCDTGFGSITITRAGDVQIINGTNTWFALNGVYFKIM